MNLVELPSPNHSQIRREEDLAFDVGLHRGEDSAYYLAKGFRVVAFEADPSLVEHCRSRFASELADGRLTIVHGAIVPTGESGGCVRFYRHPSLTMWGTTDSEWVDRREFIGDFEAVNVPRVDFAQMIAEYGMPHYMKIDIEGADADCLAALSAFAEKPRYLSIESEKFSFDALLGEFSALDALGYNRFAVVQQASIPGSELRTVTRTGAPLHYRFEADSSGGFGSDVGPWTGSEEAVDRYRQIFREYRMFGETSPIRRLRIGRVALARLGRHTKRSWPGWYDTHAARD